MTDLLRLDGRIVVVAGAGGGGIGTTVTRMAAEEGATVVAVSRSAGNLDEHIAPHTSAPIQLDRKPDLKQVHLCLGVPSLPIAHDRRFVVAVLNNLLGGGMSSRLFQEVRELRGLCYAIYAFHAPYSDTGMFGLYAGTDADDVAELMRVVVGEINSAAETINEVEVARAKAQMKAGDSPASSSKRR